MKANQAKRSAQQTTHHEERQATYRPHGQVTGQLPPPLQPGTRQRSQQG
jgi:hypothetical protein